MALLLPHSLELDYMTGCNHGEDVNCVLYNNFVDTPPVKQAGRSIIVTSLQSKCNRYSFLYLYFACNSCIYKDIKISYFPRHPCLISILLSHHFVCWVGASNLVMGPIRGCPSTPSPSLLSPKSLSCSPHHAKSFRWQGNHLNSQIRIFSTNYSILLFFF